MMLVGPLLQFVFLYICAKAMDYKVPFYIAAIAFVLLSEVVGTLITTHSVSLSLTPDLVFKGLAALVAFYLLDRYNETIFVWLSIFVASFVVLTMVL